MSVESSPATRVIEVVVVEAPGCHLCDDAMNALADAGREHAIVVRLVDMAAPEGRAIVRDYRAPMPPIVIVGGELLGWGRLSRGKLRRRLDELTASDSRP